MAPATDPEFLFDEEIHPAILSLINRAKEQLYLVSPFNDYPDDLKDALTRAVGRGVRITVVCLDAWRQRFTIRRIEELGVKVVPVQWLHSKIYISETAALATSRNLVRSASSDFCLRFEKAKHTDAYRQLEEYVLETVLGGYCIRCRTRIGFDRERPLCRDCWSIWNRFGWRGYPEKHCHQCGADWTEGNINLPLCDSCYWGC